ncbi:MAG: DUF983 domain-containing protein [bacterium]
MNFEILKRALENRCPQCLSRGKVFSGFLKMNKSCDECGYLFDKGSGYFVGSLMFNYTLCGILLFPLFLYLVIAEYPGWMVMGLPLLLLILILPAMTRMARLLWIHIDYKISSSKT